MTCRVEVKQVQGSRTHCSKTGPFGVLIILNRSKYLMSQRVQEGLRPPPLPRRVP